MVSIPKIKRIIPAFPGMMLFFVNGISRNSLGGAIAANV
jgi:hypothetical protein